MLWRWRRETAWIFVAVLLAIAAAGCGDAPRDATPVPSVSAEAAPFLLAPDRPPGLFLESLRPTPPTDDRLVVYSEPGRADPLTGRVLALTRQDDRNGDLPEGAHAVRISRFGKGRLGRQGDFTWIGWNGTAEEGEDPPYYGVIGKGLTEHELRSAADAVDKEHLRIARSGRPEGLRPFADGPMALSDGEVRFGAGTTQRWSSGPGTELVVRTMRGDIRVEALARIMTFGRPVRIRGSVGMAGSVVFPVGHVPTLTRVWREAGLIVAVTARGMPDSAVDAVIAGLRPVRGGGLDRLRASIPAYPPQRLGGPGERLVASGRNAQAMWAVFAKPLGRLGEYIVTEHGLDSRRGPIGGGSFSVKVPRRGAVFAGMSGDDGRFVEGAVGVDVARVRLALAGGRTVDLPLGRPTGPEGARWFGTWIESGQVREVAALGTHGQIVARQTHW
ncbi:hypothetical protein ABZ914_08635 [Spirillospora sp. NPDC046719]